MENAEIISYITERWSPYSFSSREIEHEKLTAMMTAAGKAPSANNEQPWLFVYTTRDNNEVFRSFVDFLTGNNREWAGFCYALIICFARTCYSQSGKPNRTAFYDTGMAVANMSVQATSMGIFLHQMGGFSIDRIKEYFRLSENIEPLTVIAAGYLGDGSNLPYELSKRDEKRRTRKAAGEISFRDNLPSIYSRM